jgi:hypothetical protein
VVGLVEELHEILECQRNRNQSRFACFGGADRFHKMVKEAEEQDRKR